MSNFFLVILDISNYIEVHVSVCPQSLFVCVCARACVGKEDKA